jgi:hypothetical protein
MRKCISKIKNLRKCISKNKESEEMPNGRCVGEIMGDFIQILLYITNFNEINLKLNSK